MADETSDVPPPPEQQQQQPPPPPPWAAPAAPQWPPPAAAPPPPSPSPSSWSYPPPAPPPPAPPGPGGGGPFGLPPRFIAAVIAAGLVVGVAVALPIALIGRNSGQPGSTNTGGSGSRATPTAPPNAGAASQARALYQQALAATRAAKGVHYTAVTSGAANQHTTGDAGQSDGTQDITVTSGFGAEQFKLLLVHDVVYFQGNVPAEEDQIGLAPAEAARLNGKWITVVRGDGPYTVLQPGITTADQAAEMPLVASTLEQVTASGKKATRIRGSVPATADVPAGTAYMDVDPSTHLPITYTSTVTAGKVTVTATTTFSNWGSAPSPSAPSGAVAWSTLNATEPPGGYGSGGGGQGTPAPA